MRAGGKRKGPAPYWRGRQIRDDETWGPRRERSSLRNGRNGSGGRLDMEGVVP